MLYDVKKNKSGEYTFTSDEILEFNRCRNNKIYFFEKYIKILHPEDGTVPFKLYPYQKTIVNNLTQYKKNIVVGPRQIGFTTIAVLDCIHSLLFGQSVAILYIARKTSIARDVFDKARRICEHLPDFLKDNLELSVNLIRVRHSTLRFATTNMVQGYVASKVILDGIVYLSERKKDELFERIIPMLSSFGGRGELTVMDTPHFDFFKCYHGLLSSGNFHTHNIKISDVPKFTKEYCKEMKENIGSYQWSQQFDYRWSFD